MIRLRIIISDFVYIHRLTQVLISYFNNYSCSNLIYLFACIKIETVKRLKDLMNRGQIPAPESGLLYWCCVLRVARDKAPPHCYDFLNKIHFFQSLLKTTTGYV